MALLAETAHTSAVQEVDTAMDRAMENSLVQKSGGCRTHHVSNGAIQVVHVDRLIPCVSLPAIGEETDDEPDTDNQPDTPDQAQVPNEVIQDIPGLFEENTLRQPQDSQTVDSQEPDSQFLPKFSGLQVVHSGSEAPGISGAIHPRLRPCDIKHKDSQVNTKILILE